MRKANLAFVCVAAAAFLTACNSRKAPPQMPPPEVLVTQPVQEDMQVRREWLGTLNGSENVDIRARVQGYLTEKRYTEGALVKKGDVLFVIDPRPFEAALAQSKAELSQAMAQQGKTDAEFQKQKELFSKNVTSQRDYDNANQNNLAAIASVEAGRAAVQRAELDLEFTTVTAPVEGIAGVSPVGIGDLVGPTATVVLTTISTVDPIKVRFPISEQQYLNASKRILAALARPLENRPLDIDLVLANGTVFPEKGRFFTLDREVDVKTGTLNAEALFPNPGSVLRPGQYAKARAVVETIPGALMVPQRAVQELQGMHQLVIVGADGKAEIRPVQAAEREGSMWRIAKGLNPGETVVVEGGQKVRNGMPVSAKPWNPPKPPGESPGEAPAPAPSPAAPANS